MQTSLLERRQMQDEALFSTITHRARKIIRQATKQNTKNETIKKDFKKLTERARRMAKRASSESNKATRKTDSCDFAQPVRITKVSTSDTRTSLAGSRDLSMPIAAQPKQAETHLPPMLLPRLVSSVAIDRPNQPAWAAWPMLPPPSSTLLSAFLLGAAWAAMNKPAPSNQSLFAAA